MVISKVSEIPERFEPLIPGLPDEIAEQCLLLLPFPDLAVARSVSTAWKRAISSPSFVKSREDLELSQPYILVFAFRNPTARMQWQAFDPRSRRWIVLPPMPCDSPVCPKGFACAAIPRQGALFVLGGMRSDTETPLRTLVTYRAATNSWAVGPPMPTARSFFAAGSIDGKVFAAGGADAGPSGTLVSVECYDTERGRWGKVANMRRGLARYDAAVIGRKLFVTEGWSWPFSFSPRGAVYDVDRDTWEEMSAGMKEGWTGWSAVVEDRLFVVSEHGDCKVKVYSPVEDAWRYVVGEGVPRQLKKPYVVCGLDGCIFVVAGGLDVGIGRVERRQGGVWTIDWKVVVGPTAFENFAPSDPQVLYA